MGYLTRVLYGRLCRIPYQRLGRDCCRNMENNFFTDPSSALLLQVFLLLVLLTFNLPTSCAAAGHALACLVFLLLSLSTESLRCFFDFVDDWWSLLLFWQGSTSFSTFFQLQSPPYPKHRYLTSSMLVARSSRRCRASLRSSSAACCRCRLRWPSS